MNVCYDDEELENFLKMAAEVSKEQIPALLCRPEDLSVGVINAYLKLKEKNVIQRVGLIF